MLSAFGGTVLITIIVILVTGVVARVTLGE